MESMQNAKKHVLLGIMLLFLSFSVISVSAFIYEQSSHSVTQTIVDIATLTLTNSALGNLEEGQTLYYTPSNQSNLNDIITVNTTKANVYLHFDSNIDLFNTVYDTFQITVKFDTVPGGSSHSSGDTACSLKISTPDYSSLVLDVAGDWTFDFEISTIALSVNSNSPNTVTITATVESTA